MDNLNSIETDRKLYDRILRYTGVFGGVQVVSVVIKMLLNVFKSRLLGPEGYGLSESFNKNTELIANSTGLGINTVAVPEISQSFDEADASLLAHKVLLTRSWALLTALLGLVVSLALAPVLSRWAFNGDSGYTVSFMVLSMSVAATAVTNGETAILKGSGLLRELALSQLLTGVVALFIVIPLFWFYRLDGVVPALLMTTVGNMVVTCFYSVRHFPYRARLFSLSLLREGTGMIGFGLFLTVAAFFMSWAWSFIARFLTEYAGQEFLGVYSAGYFLLVVNFASLLMSVIDSEYYPRLSASADDLPKAYGLMNDQSLVMCMISAPLVILFQLLAPLMVLVVLEYDKFIDSILIAQMAVMGVYFKTVSHPIAYLILARSDSKIYVVQETLCAILLIVCVMAGYKLGGTIGLGLSFSAWELSYLILNIVVGYFRYRFVMSSKLVRNFLIQGVLVVSAGAFVSLGSVIGYTGCAVLCVISLVISFRFMSRHTSFIPSILSKLSRK